MVLQFCKVKIPFGDASVIYILIFSCPRENSLKDVVKRKKLVVKQTLAHAKTFFIRIKDCRAGKYEPRLGEDFRHF